jgi:hypothetical protein
MFNQDDMDALIAERAAERKDKEALDLNSQER